jgi:hypothetical protein
MGDDGISGKLEKATEPARRSNIRRRASAKEAAHKRRQPEFEGCCPALASVAAQALSMMSGHKMTRTRLFNRFQQELTVRAYRLKTVMLHDRGLASQKGQNQRRN